MIFKLIFKKKLIELEEKKIAYENRKAHLSKDLESLTWKNEEYIRQINVLKNENGQFNRQIERLTWEKEELIKKNELSEQKIQNVVENTKKLHQRIEELQKQIENLLNEKKKLEEEIESHKKTISLLNNTIQEHQEKNGLLNKQIESLNKINSDLKLELKKLEEKNKALQDALELEKKRFQRVQFLLNNKVNTGIHCFIETTKTGNMVLNALNKTEYEIDVFDIDNTEINSKESAGWAKLWTNMRKKQIFVQDRKAYLKAGFAEVAMKHLLKFAEENSKDEISIELTEAVLNDRDKLSTIYANLGFIMKYFSPEKKEE